MKAWRFKCKDQYKDFKWCDINNPTGSDYYVCQISRNTHKWSNKNLYARTIKRRINLPENDRKTLNCQTPTKTINGKTYNRCTDNCHCGQGELCMDIAGGFKACLKVDVGYGRAGKKS